MEGIKKDYNSINKLVNGYRSFALIVFLVSIITSFFLAGLIYQVSQNGIMVVDGQGDILYASKSSESEVFQIEADNHIRLFYSRFFSYDKETFKKQTELGLFLAGKSALNLYETYKSKGWYDNVVTNDLVISSYVQKIQFSSINNETHFIAVGFQKITRGNYVENRNLNIKGTIDKKNSGRKMETNPHGLEIDNIVIIDNNTITNSSLNP